VKKLPLLVGLLVAAGFAAEANAFVFSNPGALNLGANLSSQTGISGGVTQGITATQGATATVNHTGANSIGQTATATNAPADPPVQVGSGVNENFGNAGDSAFASNGLSASAASGSVTNTTGQANIGGAYGGLLSFH